ncbi:hypothetical protein BC830DRAFT_59581 [Chytriomyces sp. MP71]|nr:hypothetical protein BC830DRAFT_59581 [Chytriomyces sp. MP71]
MLNTRFCLAFLLLWSIVQPNEVFRPSMLGTDFPGFIEEGTVSNRVLIPTAMGGIVKDIYGADILDGKFVLMATERGLFFNEISTPRIEPIPLIRNIRFKQVQVLSDYNVLMALSGKHNHVRQYKLSSIRKLIYYLLGMNPALLAKTNMNSGQDSQAQGPEQLVPELDEEYKVVQDREVEDEATLIAKWTNDYIKILATKDSGSFLIQRTESSIFMGVLFARDVILFEWAKDPYLRFMKLKAFWLPELPKFMNLITDGLSVREVYMAYAMEANLVQVSDSKVIEVDVHREFLKSAQATGGGYRPRWQSFNQIPFSEAKRNELKSMSRPNNTVNRKLLAVTGPGSAGSTSVDRYFLGTFHRLTRVVDISSQPMMGSGVGGWRDGVTWLEAPNHIVMRPVDYVMAVGSRTIEVADWRSAHILQVLKVDNSATIKVLGDVPGRLLVMIDRGRKGSVLYHLKEKKEPVAEGEKGQDAAIEVKVESDLAKLNLQHPLQGQEQPPGPQLSQQPHHAPANNKHRILPDVPGQQLQPPQQERRPPSEIPVVASPRGGAPAQSPRLSASERPSSATDRSSQNARGSQDIAPRSSSHAGSTAQLGIAAPAGAYQQQPSPQGQQYAAYDPRYAQYYAQQQQQYQYYMAQQQGYQAAPVQAYQPAPGQSGYDSRYGPPAGAQYADPRYAAAAGQYHYYAQQGYGQQSQPPGFPQQGPPAQGYQQGPSPQEPR